MSNFIGMAIQAAFGFICVCGLITILTENFGGFWRGIAVIAAAVAVVFIVLP